MWIRAYAFISLLCLMIDVPNLYAVNFQTVIFNVTLNRQMKGDFFVNLTDDRDILVTREDLHAMGIQNPSSIEIEIEGESYLSLRALAGVSFLIHDELLRLDITADPSLLPKQVIDLSYTRDRHAFSGDTSGFLNYQLDYTTSSPSGIDTIDLNHQLGAYHRGWAFLSDAIYTQTKGEKRWTRLMSNATYDFHKDYTRLVVGDFFARPSEFASSLTMGGLSFSKNYTFNPFFIRSPQMWFSGATSLQSELEVFLDGVQIYRTTLSPGAFQIDNISTRSGAGLLEVILTDPFGKEDRILTHFYRSASLLKKGLHDYSYRLGFLREELGEKNADYGPLAFSGIHKYGVNNFTSVEGSMEWAEKSGVFTTSATSSRLFGALTVLFGASRNDAGEFGEALRLRFTYLGKVINETYDFTWLDQDFSLLQALPTVEKIQYNGGAGIGFGIKSFGYINFNYRRTEKYVRANSWSTSAAYSRNLGRNTSLSISLIHAKEVKTNTSIFIGIQYYAVNQSSLSVNARKDKDAHIETVQLQKNPPTGEGLGGRGLYQRSTQNGKTIESFDTSLSYNLKYGIVGGKYRYSEGAERKNLSVAGALTYVGNTVSLSRPITAGFGLVTVDQLEGVRITQNGQDMGKTDSSGKLLLPNLAPYYDNSIAIDDRDIPLDFSIEKVTETISPVLQSGVVIPFKLKKFRAIGGQIYLQEAGEKKPAELLVVTVKMGNDEVLFQTGYGGEFYLEDLSPGNYTASIEVPESICSFALEIPESEEIFIELGELICETIN